MPTLRYPTPEELEQFRQKGVDIEAIKGQKLQFADPSDSVGDISTGQAIRSTLSAHKGGILGGGAGALGGGALLTSLGLAPFTEGMSLIPSVLALTGLAGTSMVAGYGGQKLQEKLEGPEKTQQLQQALAQAEQAHPVVTKATDIAASALAAGGAPSIATPVRALSGGLRGLVGKGVSEAEKAALKNVTINAALNPAINTAISAATGNDIKGSDIAEQALGGALFSGRGPLSRLHVSENPALPESQEPTQGNQNKVTAPPEVKSPYKEMTNGKYNIDDTAVRTEFKKQNPKPDTTDMSDTDAYAAQSKYRQLLKMGVDEMRNDLHTKYANKASEEAATAKKAKDEAYQQSLYKAAGVAEEPKVEPKKPETNIGQIISKEEGEALLKEAGMNEETPAEKETISSETKIESTTAKGLPTTAEQPPAKTVSSDGNIQSVERKSTEEIKPTTPDIEPTAQGGAIGRVFRSAIDKVRDIQHPSAKPVADAFQKVYQQREQYIGKQLNPILDAAEKYDLTDTSDKRLESVARYERETGQQAPSTMFRTQAERAVFNTAKQSLKANFEERFNNKEPIYRNGQPTMPQRDEFYWPTTTNPKVAEIYRSGKPEEIAKYDKIFLDYQKKLGIEDKTATDNLANWKSAIESSASKSGSVGNQQFFNASRKAQGIPLPPEFTRPGFIKNIEAYFHRQATDNAYYKHIESNPQVMSALNETSDPWGNKIPKDQSGNTIAGHDAVRSVLNEIKGETGGRGYHNERALSSIATTLFIGPGTTVHKVVSNLIGATNYVDNPIQLGRLLTAMVTNAHEGLQHAMDNGIIKLTARSYHDVLNGTLSGAERLQAVAKTIRGVYSLNDLTDKWTAGLMQAGMESVLPAKIAKANKGDVSQQQLLRRLDPDYRPGKEYNKEGLSKLASGIVASIHGTGDARTLPPWMLADTELRGFFRLSNWSISQTNRFFSDIYTPATKGNFAPLMNSLFGAAVGGYMIKELREKLQGKKGQIPSLPEIAASDKGLSGNLGLVGYNLMAAASYAGFGGMLTQLGKVPVDWIHKNTSQGMVFPLDELATDTAHTIGQAVTAIANDPNLNWLRLGTTIAGHFLTTNFQLGRVAYNQAINNGIITGTPAEKKMLSDKVGELRRFNMTEGLPYNELDASGNPLMNLEQKAFKLEQDPEKALKMLPQLVQNLIEKYGNNPDVLMEKMKGLKQNTYQTFPSIETMPIQFRKYLDYLTKLKGHDAANSALIDYVKHKTVNQAKAEVVP